MAVDPMAAQGGAPAPEGAPAEGGGDQLGDLITNLTDGFSMLTDVMGEVNPDLGQRLLALGEEFKAIVDEGMSGGAPGGSGAVAPEAGGAKAVPASPAGIPRG